MTTHHTSRTTHRRNERPLCITCTLEGRKYLANTVRYRNLFCRIPQPTYWKERAGAPRTCGRPLCVHHRVYKFTRNMQHYCTILPFFW
ncbi:hypothetical protein GDO78_007885 [Eleutherodactylus coqui]|uniref:Uncharacterized protein n=1 Tax=Eleutherodactylus coqui TaxID=57060 RepID=A0A8J6FIF9_ELECQ|nr:hypothetical protein GDO78_007885 [Eleutherodactylus coqui]